ncbi:response regulator [Microcoleus sp. herbarium7]|uniref:hybrid sensor histidine kinase/response regulator n=1 Tax=Microcoleus sp. herbarium7 TaxID=3055435 RepID=UPI002FD000DF
MSQDKEREIQLQFLEEAQEYLDTIESVLLGLAGNQISGQQMDAVLRAAHSVKGGAGMMGYGALSQLAHRLEDSFKVLKVQRNSIVVDGALESLLLTGVDRLRQILVRNRQGTSVDEHWLETEGHPVFEKLRDRLGDPVADDASSMLGSDEGTNVAALLFETEVEGCLVRLESVLADPAIPCLEEEVSIMAQELGGLGEMLQLEAFTQLCESIIYHLTNAPEAVREIAQLALNAWRKSQALVLVGQVASLPAAINWTSQASPQATPRLSTFEEDWLQAPQTSDFDFGETPSELDVESVPTFTQAIPLTASVTQAELDQEILDVEPAIAPDLIEIQPLTPTPTEAVVENPYPEVLAEEFDRIELNQETIPELVTADNSRKKAETAANSSLSRTSIDDEREVPANEVVWQKEKKQTKNTANQAEGPENSVRIPVRQLDRLNDLFGELTIERNGLSLHLGRLRGLIENLTARVSNLEQSNIRLRTAYDTVATQTGGRIESSLTKEETKNQPNYLALQPAPSYGDSGYNHNNRFDALEMDRYSDLHLLSMEVMETIVQIQEVTSDISLSLEDTDTTARELNQTAKQLQTNLTRVRMRPLSDLVSRFSRALRDLSVQYGKQVELKVLGKGTLIDRSILEAMNDPLMHLVRNAFDHGIEPPATRVAQGKPPQAVIEIKAAHRGNQTIITVSDDGNGINLNKIRARAEAMGLDAGLLAAASEDELLSLIFEPGFSTADQVTALSGRGVGMDVVRNNLKQIRGDIRVDTQPGRGTTFTLTVPFTLSVARVLLVESNGMLLAFPTDVIEEMLLLRQEQVLTTPGSEVLSWQGEMVPLIRLGASLTFYCPRRVSTLEGVPSIGEPTVLMISQGEQLQGIQVDRCWGEREVAIRKIEGPLAMPPGMSSACVLGDGKVVPLVDASALLRWIKSTTNPTRNTSVTRRTITDAPNNALTPTTTELKEVESFAYKDNPPRAIPISQKDTILVVDDSINVRRFLALALEKAGYLVEQAKDGQDAVEQLLGGLAVKAVICDIEMPRLDGYGFLARVKSDSRFSTLPIAMLTSRSGDKHRQLAMTLGAAAYFSKPYNERELLLTLKQLITENPQEIPVPIGVR